MAAKKSSSSKKTTTSKSSSSSKSTPKEVIGTGAGGQKFFVGGVSSSPAPKATPVAAPKVTTKTPIAGKSTGAPSAIPGGVDVIGESAGQKFFVGGANPLTTPEVSPVTTSDSARDTYSALQESINKLSKNVPAISTLYDGEQYKDVSSLIGAQRKGLESRRAADLARINTEFSQAAEGQVQEQKGEVGTASMGLARIGGFDSASGQAALTNLERVHVSEQSALRSQRESAIRLAQNAYEDKDFALAQLQLDEAKKNEQLMYDRQKDFVSLTLQLRGEQRADLSMELQQTQFEYQKNRDTRSDQRQAAEFALNNNIKTPFYVIGGVGYDTSTGEALPYEEYIKRGGDPNFQSNVKVIDPGSKLEQQYVLDLASKYPDANIDIKNDDAQIAQSKIQGSRIYKEQVRPPSSGGGGGSSKESAVASLLSSTQATLDAQRGQSGDKYANPDTYRASKAAFVSAGGTAANFFQMFPPEVYIAPSNRKGDLDIYKSSNANDLLMNQFQSALLSDQ